jgi:hypothetical protein
LGFIYQENPQLVSDYIVQMQQKYFGNDIEGFLNRYPTKEFESDTDYEWELHSEGVDNIALVEARIDGTAVTAADIIGLGTAEFELVFAKDWFSEGEKIVGERNEVYPIRIKTKRAEGSNTVYTCELMLPTDSGVSIPYEELVSGKLFSREYHPVSRTLSTRGREVQYKTGFKMRNGFTQIRMQKRTPGNLKSRKLMGAAIKSGNTVYKVWEQYESFMFKNEFRKDINRALLFGVANRNQDGNYSQKDISGYSIQEGAGLRQQTESANTSFYTTFDIEDLASRLMDLSEAKLGNDERAFLMSCGERGAFQFHKSLEEYSQLFTPTRDMSRIYNVSKDGVKMGMGYGGQFVEFNFINSVSLNLSVMGMYDDRSRNKIMHPDVGTLESRRYDIYDIGTNNGEANIRKVKSTLMPSEIWAYIPGIRDPFSPDGAMNKGPKLCANPTDGWEEHLMWQGGVMVMDPSRTASFICNAI